jgi:hypothetical protein
VTKWADGEEGNLGKHDSYGKGKGPDVLGTSSEVEEALQERMREDMLNALGGN